MARPRTYSDDELLERIEGGLAPSSASWTLVDAARAAGVHPATLVKRFGSRRDLLLVLSRRWMARISETPRTEHHLTELRAWVESVGSPPHDRTQALAGVSMLLEDLRDDELSALLETGWQRQATYLAALVEGAAHDLPRAPDPRTAGTLLLDVVNGAYLRAAAAARPASTLAPKTELDALLESWT